MITSLIGGTIGGYITYAGAHRMVDSGITGPENAKRISNSSVLGIIITGVMRFLLFLAILGVVAGGAQLTGENLAAQAFEHAAGEIGLRLFGLILWAASISSVIGAAYTSVSFLTSDKTKAGARNILTVAFIVFSAIESLPSFQAFLLAVAIAGVILNRVSSPRHERVLRDACAHAGLEAVGAVPGAAALEVPARHLGLIPAAERGDDAVAAVAAMTELVERHVDVERIAAVVGEGAGVGPRPEQAVQGARGAHARGQLAQQGAPCGAVRLLGQGH